MLPGYSIGFLEGDCTLTCFVDPIHHWTLLRVISNRAFMFRTRDEFWCTLACLN